MRFLLGPVPPLLWDDLHPYGVLPLQPLLSGVWVHACCSLFPLLLAESCRMLLFADVAAAHEVLRQIWVFSNQTFTALDIATQVRQGRAAQRTAVGLNVCSSHSCAKQAGGSVCVLCVSPTAVPPCSCLHAQAHTHTSLLACPMPCLADWLTG